MDDGQSARAWGACGPAPRGRDPARSPGTRAALRLCVLALLALPVRGVPCHAQEGPSTALPRALQHRALHARARAWRALAAEGGPHALETLLRAYDERSEHAQGRALLASIVVASYAGAEHAEALAAWRAGHDHAEHLWLWYSTLCADVLRGDVEHARSLARAPVAAWTRAAALHALSRHPHPDPAWLEDPELRRLPDDEVERALVLEALAEGWAACSRTSASGPLRGLGLWLVDQLEGRATPERSRVRIQRALARTLPSGLSLAGPDHVRAQIVDSARPLGEGHRYAPPAGACLLDLLGTGTRVVYVVDVSGSMAEPLTDRERADLARLCPPRATVPVVRTPARARGAAGGHGASMPASPWDGVRTRVDAAVELLRVSLRGLPRDAHFSVVLFASKHAFLKATPGLVPASAAHVLAALRELDRLVVGSDSPLGGGTNLHGGLLRGLNARSRGRPGPADPLRDLVQGADTLFVLSDGCPSEDDWSAEEPERQRSRSFDPHAAEGTYVDHEQLLQDVARINLLRRCEIHAVSIGADGSDLTADNPGVGSAAPSTHHLLQRLVALGGGRYRALPSLDALAAGSPERVPLELR